MYDSRYAFHSLTPGMDRRRKSWGDLKRRPGWEYCKRTRIGGDKQVKDSVFDVGNLQLGREFVTILVPLLCLLWL